MVHQEGGTLSTGDGLMLATRCWTPAREPKAAVLIVHGLSEHSGRYSHVAEHLVGRGYGVFSYDHRHHGRSGGQPRALLSDFDILVDDLQLVLDWVVRASSGRRVFLLGHSLGGAVAARYVAVHGSDHLGGLILSSAAIRIPDEVAPFLRRFAPVIGRVVPLLPILTRDTYLLSRDPEVRRAWKRDPLTYKGRLRSRTGQLILRNTVDLVEQAASLTLPLLVMHGTADRITDPAGSQLLYDASLSTDKTLELFEGFYHELFNEVGRQQVLDDVAAWLDARVSR